MRSLALSLSLTVCTIALFACPASGEKGTQSAAAGAVAQQPPAEDESAAEGAEVAQTPGPAPKGAEFHWLPAKDGIKVASWYWPPKADGSPAVILLHQRGKDKSSWGDVPEKLLAEGYSAIAIDLRGHGETTDAEGRRIKLDDLGDADYAAMLNDVAAANDFLLAQRKVDAEHIAIFGASIGANLAIIFAAGERDVRAVVALSPGLDYKGLKPADFLKGYSTRPLFLIASTGDRQSYEDCLALEKLAVEAKPVHTRYFEGRSGHGTDMLTQQNGLEDTMISGFLLNYLPPER